VEEMNEIKVICEHCETAFNAGYSLQGEDVACPQCNQYIYIPLNEDMSAEEIDVNSPFQPTTVPPEIKRMNKTFPKKNKSASTKPRKNMDMPILFGFIFIIIVIFFIVLSYSKEKTHLGLDGQPVTEEEAFRQKAKCFMCGKKATKGKETHDFNMCSEYCKQKFLKEKPELQR
jgi:hypothetical protein